MPGDDDMRVLLIDVNCKGSSTGKIVFDLYPSLNTQPDEVSICYGRGDEIDEPGIYKFGLGKRIFMQDWLE